MGIWIRGYGDGDGWWLVVAWWKGGMGGGCVGFLRIFGVVVLERNRRDRVCLP
jgi:hypothetical protein